MAERPAPARRAAHDRGLAAEARAAAVLEQAGFSILARRARTQAGEIDLIARQDGLLVFCEVKARGDRDTAAYSLLPRQRRRIAAAAEAWLADRPELALLDARFDAILVTARGEAEHIAGAFEMET